MSAAEHISAAWIYKQHLRLMITEAAKGQVEINNQFCDNFCVLMKMRADELQAALDAGAEAIDSE